jgi:hypothetical protein
MYFDEAKLHQGSYPADSAPPLRQLIVTPTVVEYSPATAILAPEYLGEQLSLNLFRIKKNKASRILQNIVP